MAEQIVTPRTEVPEVELQKLADTVKAMQKDFRRGYTMTTLVGDLLAVRRQVVVLAESMGFTEAELDRTASRRRDEIATY